MLTAGHLVWTDTDPTAVTLRVTRASTVGLRLALAIALQTVALALVASLPPDGRIDGNLSLWRLFAALILAGSSAIAVATLTDQFVRLRAAVRSTVHPRLRHWLTVRLAPADPYRKDPRVREVTLDGHSFDAGAIVAVAVQKTDGDDPELRLHLVFDRGAVELDVVRWTLRREAEANRFAEALSKRLGCPLTFTPWGEVPGNPASLLSVLATSLSVGSFVFLVTWDVPARTSHPAVAAAVFAVLLVVHVLAVAWGTWWLTKERDWDWVAKGGRW